ncbi:tyrosine-type recombinase/integrase [Mongoliimonas terrestris]|uniref:tyrosine-type recombinase/integrase n=1 Tax=Mongoliimonas terrestris TaxID=1709001 RepID=UPI0009499149|nr:tyrosine-type recombinase/integrase [Mongoliimonas terrestris]
MRLRSVRATLTDAAIRKLKPAEKAYKKSDGGGLYLFVTPAGARSWRMDYRVAGAWKTITLGLYPAVSLAEARRLRDEARALLARDLDPAAERGRLEAAKKAEAADTFGAVADELLARHEQEGRAPATMKKRRWHLDVLCAPLRARPLREITPQEVLAVLKGIEADGYLETAHRVKADISAVYRLAISTLRAQFDPAQPLKGALLKVPERNRPAIVDELAFGKLINRIEADCRASASTRHALLFQALTAARPGEVRLATWAEVDLEAAVWRIPAARMKMKRAHDVPLSRQAVALLKRQRDQTEGEDLVFPSSHRGKAMSDMTFNAALRRMGVTDHVSHGFRSSFSTILNERGHPGHVIETALAHVEPNAVRRAYNRAVYWPERMALLQAWADLIDDMKRQAAIAISHDVQSDASKKEGAAQARLGGISSKRRRSVEAA